MMKTYYIEISRAFTTLRIISSECEDKEDAYDKMITEWPVLASIINKSKIEELK